VSIERKLATILAADVVGYSRSMATDEEGTVARLKGAREIIDNLIAAHHGRVFHTAGDSVVAEFTSPVEAVRCAAEIQRRLRTCDTSPTEEGRMRLRIGVNLGDVMVDGDNLLGDGVNIAARLESIAEPETIYLSASVHEQVRNKLDLVCDDVGTRSLKNIPEPVRVFRVRIDGGRAPGLRKPTLQRLRTVAVAVLAVVVLVAAGTWLSWPAPLGFLLDYVGLSSLPVNPPLPDKPSIVVLPFTNLSGDREQEYLAEGLTEDITADLGQLKWLFVISRNTAFTYKGQAVNVANVSRELGVRYLVEGSVRKVGDRARVTVQLIDATRDRHTWSERYDRKIGDLLGLQSEISERIIAALGVEIPEAEANRLRRKPTTSLSAYEAYVRGMVELRKITRPSLAEARTLFERAIEEDPQYAAAHAALAATYFVERILYCPQDGSRVQRAAEIAERAVALDPYEPVSHIALSEARWAAALPEEAVRAAERAVDLAPNLDLALNALGTAYLWAGQPLRGLTALGQALRLSPRPTPPFMGVLGIANYVSGRRTQAVEFFERARAASPDVFAARVWLVFHYEAIGERDRARTIAQEVLRQNPDCTVEYLIELMQPVLPTEFGPLLERAGFARK